MVDEPPSSSNNVVGYENLNWPNQISNNCPQKNNNNNNNNNEKEEEEGTAKILALILYCTWQ